MVLVRVLVLEDDGDLRLAVSLSLRGAGFAVDAVADLPAADEALAVNAYDCAVFDRRLPGGDALVYVRDRLAAGSPVGVPVLFLTAMDAVTERIAGLEYGDDYLVKPFAMEELIARTRALCRPAPSLLPPVLRCGDLEIDTGRREVRRAGVLLTVTVKEFAVLEWLVARQGGPVTRVDLLRHCWDPMADPASNVVDVVIAALRRKLRAPAMIHTVRGTGYRISPA